MLRRHGRGGHARQGMCRGTVITASLIVLACATTTAAAQDVYPPPLPDLRYRGDAAPPSVPREKPRRAPSATKNPETEPASAPKAAPRPKVDVVTEALSVDDLIDRLRHPRLNLVDARGGLFASERSDTAGPSETLSEPTIVAALRHANLSDEQADTLWTIMAFKPNEGLLQPAVVEALLRASKTAAAGDAMWEALAGSAADAARAGDKPSPLISMIEQNRKSLLPVLTAIPDTPNADDDVMTVVLSTKVFAAREEDSIVFMAGHKPATVARRIERDREHGKPAWWEYTAFKEMLRWRSARFGDAAPKAPSTMAAFDQASETFVTIFNSLHGMSAWYREQMMQGLPATDLFNIVVSGEQELYRLGTSGYRQFLHPKILAAIKDVGSFEAFLQRATMDKLGPSAVEAAGRRALVLLRITSSFGLIDGILESIQNRDTFIESVIAALGDPLALEGSGSVVVDLLTARSRSPVVGAFKESLLARLYERHRTSPRADRQRVYGSMLATYQAITGDQRDPTIERSFPFDRSSFTIPFDRLFSVDEGRPRHRMFMRFDQDLDAARTHTSFRRLMDQRGATIRVGRHHDVFVLTDKDRTIEIHANRPTARGVREGIVAIAEELAGKRVESVVGRGHTGIVTPLQRDARRILGDRVKDVATVIVGSCGGNASARQMIDTFGYVPFVASKSIGRVLINNAILEAYLDALFTLPRSDTLELQPILDRAVTPFMTHKRDPSLREDAALYLVNVSTALSAYMFDKHVRQASTASTQ